MLDLYQRYQSSPNNISKLKLALQSTWHNSPQDPTDRYILSFTKRGACIKANGIFWLTIVWGIGCMSEQVTSWLYRAMLCIAVAKRLSICLYVRPPQAGIVSKRTNNILNLFSPSGSHTILVFPHQTVWQYPDGISPNGGVECRWGLWDMKKIAIFDQYLALSRKQYGHGMRTGNCTQAFEWYHFQSPWMNNNANVKVTSLFDAEYFRNGTRRRHSYDGILIIQTYRRRAHGTEKLSCEATRR